MLPTKFQFIWLRVSEEKIKMWKAKGRRNMDDRRQVMAKAHLCLWQGELKMALTWMSMCKKKTQHKMAMQSGAYYNSSMSTRESWTSAY